MRRIFCLCFSLLFALFGCGSSSSKGCRVGVDASWYPLTLGERDNAITAFSTELLSEIGKIEKIPFVKVTVNWDVLMEGLQKDQYQAILTSMPPYIFNQKLFDYSDLYLPLGPVLVVNKQSNIDALSQLEGKEIGVVSGDTNSTLILEKSQGVLIRYYDTIPSALNAVSTGTIDGAMVDVLSATAYCRDLYQDTLKIATPPLNEEGLRLVTKHNANPKLIKSFNEGLERLKKNGAYAELMDKWGL